MTASPAPQEPLFTPKLINAMQHALGSYTRSRVTRDEAALIVLLSLKDSGYELVERRHHSSSAASGAGEAVMVIDRRPPTPQAALLARCLLCGAHRIIDGPPQGSAS